jgi:hypothetical protein
LPASKPGFWNAGAVGLLGQEVIVELLEEEVVELLVEVVVELLVEVVVELVEVLVEDLEHWPKLSSKRAEHSGFL